MKKKGIRSILLTGAVLLSMNTTVFAADIPTVGMGDENQGAIVSITKNLEFAEGITVPTATFNFEVTKITDDAPEATITDISYNASDAKGALKDGKYTIAKDSAITFGNFPHSGLFEYNVSEINGGMNGVTYSTTNYRLRVYVANKVDGGTYIRTITAEDGNTKKDKVLFTNTYVKNGGSEFNADEALKIEKQTIGTLADKTKEFTFKLKLIKAATTNEEDIKGKIGNKEIIFKYGEEKEFNLSDKQALVFKNLPAGTRYIVTEVGVEDGYTPTVKVVENGIKNQDKQGTDAEDLISTENKQGNLVGEKENSVTFINEYRDVPITGIIESNMPFILLIGVGLSAFGVLAIAKKREIAER